MEPYAKLAATLSARGFKPVDLDAWTFQGSLKVEQYTVRVELRVRGLNFVNLPIATLLDDGGLPAETIAHLDETGICYAAPGTLLLDQYEPGKSILRVLECIQETLRESVKGGTPGAVLTEFPLYWHGERIYRCESEDQNLVMCIDTVSAKKHGIMVRPDMAEQKPRFEKVADVKKVLVDRMITPPTKPERENLKGILDWLRRQGIEPDEELWGAIVDRKLIWIVSNNGEVGFCVDSQSLIGRIPAGNRNARVWKQHLARINVHRFIVEAADASSIVLRNLNDTPSLLGKNVLVLGCGTVGGFVASLLNRSGAGVGGKLALIDNQTLTSGNLGRHLLPFDYVGLGKSASLKQELLRSIPGAEILALKADAVEYFNNKAAGFDLVIDTLGDEVTSVALNHMLQDKRKLGFKIACIHGWVWDNGISVQALLNQEGGACFKCLRPRIEEPWRHDPRKDVTAIPTIVSPRCGDGAFTPFSASASMAAASLVNKLALEWAGGIQGSILESIGLDYSKVKNNERRKLFPYDGCPACDPR
ncbi:MAG: ThiF family adenylyltransferase [Alphaproteobacteria bacterium]